MQENAVALRMMRSFMLRNVTVWKICLPAGLLFGRALKCHAVSRVHQRVPPNQSRRKLHSHPIGRGTSMLPAVTPIITTNVPRSLNGSCLRKRHKLTRKFLPSKLHERNSCHLGGGWYSVKKLALITMLTTRHNHHSGILQSLMCMVLGRGRWILKGGHFGVRKLNHSMKLIQAGNGLWIKLAVLTGVTLRSSYASLKRCRHSITRTTEFLLCNMVVFISVMWACHKVVTSKSMKNEPESAWKKCIDSVQQHINTGTAHVSFIAGLALEAIVSKMKPVSTLHSFYCLVQA